MQVSPRVETDGTGIGCKGDVGRKKVGDDSGVSLTAIEPEVEQKAKAIEGKRAIVER